MIDVFYGNIIYRRSNRYMRKMLSVFLTGGLLVSAVGAMALYDFEPLRHFIYIKLLN